MRKKRISLISKVEFGRVDTCTIVKLYYSTVLHCVLYEFRAVSDRWFSWRWRSHSSHKYHNRRVLPMPSFKRERAVLNAYAYDSIDNNENDPFCMIDPYETCTHDSESSNDDDEYDATSCARAQTPNTCRSRKYVRICSSLEKRFILEPKANDRYMLWFNDFSKIDGESANGEQLFDLYIMTCVRSNNISMPVDEHTKQNTIITHTAMHIIRAKNSGQITESQYDDFMRVIHDYRKGMPAQKMVEYIVRIHRCNPLLLGRIFGVFRALSKSAAAAYLHCLLSSCAIDQYNLSITFIMKMCSIVLKRKSLACVLDWIKATQHPTYHENQTVPFSKLCSTLLYGLVIYEPPIYTNPTLSAALLSGIDRHYTKECNTTLNRSGLFQHIELLKAHDFPLVELIALEHMLGMLSKEGLALMAVRHTLDRIVHWCIVHKSQDYDELSGVRPIYNKLVQSMYKRVFQRLWKIRPDDVRMLEHTSELVNMLGMCK